MTRQTLPEAPPDTRSCDPLARAAATAAALIELAIHESLVPVATLGQALARIAAATPQSALDLRAEVTVCIESLQFHDRMAQQLTQVRDLLAGATADAPQSADPSGWPMLRERLRTHFTTESHRMLFNLLMPAGEQAAPLRLHAEEGSVELF
jgi:hypothetical protein